MGLPILMGILIVMWTRDRVFQDDPELLSKWILLDLMFTIPLLYLILIRNAKISKYTVVPILMAGMWLSGLVVPDAYQLYFPKIKMGLLFIIEAVIVYTLVTKIRKIILKYKFEKNRKLNFLEAAKEAIEEVFPKKIAAIVMSEVAVFYYLFFSWLKTPLTANTFSYHKKSGTLITLYVLMGLFIMEASVVHMILMKWSPTIAWVLTVLSIYTMLQIIAFIRSMPKNPIVIDNGNLILRYGYLRSSIIPVANVEAVELSQKSITIDTRNQKLSPFAGLESHNIIIHLREKAILKGVYGFKKSYTSIALYVDDREGLKKALIAAGFPFSSL